MYLRLAQRLGVAAIILAVSVFSGCGKKPKVYVAIIDSDTLTLASCKALVPDSALPAIIVAPLMRQMLLARRDTMPADTLLMADLARQLTLQSGQQWNRGAAQLLYKAARTLRRELLQAGSAQTFMHALDSQMNRRVVIVKRFPYPPLADSPDSVWKRNSVNDTMLKRALPRFCVSLFAVNPAAAAWVCSFLFSEEATESKARNNIKQMIAGLIFDSVAAKKTAAAAKAAPPLNNKEIIKHRSRQSIIDSIGKHSAELEGIYKIRLKLALQLAGTVRITFRIRADGSVVSADLASSQIRDQKFLEALQAYALTMHFKPVAATLGDMTFEFPFTFTPEQ